MNPVIVIPSYWTLEGATSASPAPSPDAARASAPASDAQRARSRPFVGPPAVVYDHATPVATPMPELETCLASLEKVRGVLRVVVLLVADQSCEEGARARVDGICRSHPNLSPVVVGAPEAAVVERAVGKVSAGLAGTAVGLRGYGAIRNMGLAVAAVLGHDVVVFMDDDEVALDDRFLIDGVYGLGLSNRQGLPIVAKSGYFLDRFDSPYADVDRPRWRDRPWSKRDEFNRLMQRLLTGTRISRSTYICGGCFALAATAFCKVGFDPAIPRGEDLDYLINLRMNGLDAWFDSQWRVKHLPPEGQTRATRFLQDVYRWEYERRKIETVNATIGLRHVTPESLAPYPGVWMGEEAGRRARSTALRRALVGPERDAYLRVLARGQRDARAWASAHARSYLAFQTYWPRVMELLWDNGLLARRVVELGTPAALAVPAPAWEEGEDAVPLELAPSSLDAAGGAGLASRANAPVAPATTWEDARAEGGANL